MAEVLVVDDDEGIRETIRAALEDAGYRIREARDGIAGLDALRASEHALIVLLDQVMPRMDGMSVLRTVASEGGGAMRHAYVLLTASPQILAKTAITLAPDMDVRVLPKPFDVDALIEMVEQCAQRLHTL